MFGLFKSNPTKKLRTNLRYEIQSKRACPRKVKGYKKRIPMLTAGRESIWDRNWKVLKAKNK